MSFAGHAKLDIIGGTPQPLLGEMLLPYLPAIVASWQSIYDRYQQRLLDVPSIRRVPPLAQGFQPGCASMPIHVHEAESGLSRDQLHEPLKQYNVFARRRFCALIRDFACYPNTPVTDPLPVACAATGKILTFPIFYDLALTDVDRICELIEAIPHDTRITAGQIADPLTGTGDSTRFLADAGPYRAG